MLITLEIQNNLHDKQLKIDRLDGKENILPDLKNNIETFSGTSESVLNDWSRDSIEDSSNFNILNGSPYKIELKKHISDYIKSKNAIKNSYMSSQNPNK